jgi:hypothetical protein
LIGEARSIRSGHAERAYDGDHLVYVFIEVEHLQQAFLLET